MHFHTGTTCPNVPRHEYAYKSTCTGMHVHMHTRYPGDLHNCMHSRSMHMHMPKSRFISDPWSKSSVTARRIIGLYSEFHQSSAYIFSFRFIFNTPTIFGPPCPLVSSKFRHFGLACDRIFDITNDRISFLFFLLGTRTTSAKWCRFSFFLNRWILRFKHDHLCSPPQPRTLPTPLHEFDVAPSTRGA